MVKIYIPESNKPQHRGPLKLNKYNHIIEGHSKRRFIQRKLKETWISTTIENGRLVRCDLKGKKVVELKSEAIKQIIKSLEQEVERLKLMPRDYSIRIAELNLKIKDLGELYKLEGMRVVYNIVAKKIITAFTFGDPWKDRIMYKRRLK